MTKVSIATSTMHFSPWVKQDVVRLGGNILLTNWLEKTWPAGARFEFGVTIEER